jgi:anti-anti-sigma factor
MLKVDIQSAPPVVTLICSGRIVLGVEAETLRCATKSRAERHLLLELSRVHTIDAAGLGLLVELHVWAQQRSARLSVANPSLPARRLIALASLDRVLHFTGLPPEAFDASGSDEWQTMTA